jgi:hypothetical protein
MTFALGGAFAFGDRFEAGGHMPFYVQNGQDLASATSFGERPPRGTILGDLTLHAKARVLRNAGPAGELVAGVLLALTLPTGTDDEFAGTGKPAVRPIALVTFSPRGSKIALQTNLGGVIRTTSHWHDVAQGSGVVWGLGASYRLRDDMLLGAEVFGELLPAGIREASSTGAAMGPARNLDTIEGLLGLHYQMERRVNLGLALGRGLTADIGAPALRGVLTVTFTPSAAAPGVVSKRVVGDADHDGIPDDVDRCPDEAEDRDGFEDDDGCPDPDNDHDGIADAADKCPNVPEDRDGFEDLDGCPDLDNDHDGIPDAVDRCPNQPETINGNEDDDGCPDDGVSLIKIAHDRIDLAEAIQFAPDGKVASASYNVLGQLGATLRAHTEILKVKIVVHQAEAHAAAIRDWLLQYGIKSERLEAVSSISAATEERIDVIIE